MRHVEVGHLCFCGLPGRVEAPRFDPFATKEIYAPGLRGIEAIANGADGDCQLGSPDVRPIIKQYSRPHSARDVMQAFRSDVEVEPLSVGTDFKLLVALLAKAVGLKK